MSILEAISPTAKAVLAGGMEHPELSLIQRRFLELYRAQRAYLAGKPTAFLEDLLHRAEEQRYHQDYSARTAGEVNRAACLSILDERGKQ